MPKIESNTRQLEEMQCLLLKKRRGGKILSDGVGVVKMPLPCVRPFFKTCTMPRPIVHHSLCHKDRAYHVIGLCLNL